MTVHVIELTGENLESAIPALANLRIQIFREWPYLYDGDLAYEEAYLKRFRKADRAFLAVAKDGEDIVGAATAAPLSGEEYAFKNPFESAGYDTTKIFYFAESLLLPAYRGRGIGHQFFDAREAHARSFDTYTHTAFCAVVRTESHPKKPQHYHPLDGFWQ